MILYLRDDIKKYFSTEQSLFDQMMALRGESFRHQKGRLTQRIQLGDKSYFIKQHHGIGWKEIFKNLLQWRWPITGARNEWLAIERLQTLGVHVPRLAAYGEEGKNPAHLRSFILMEELAPVISLEDLGKTWRTQPPTFSFKQQLIAEVARIARVLHQNGMNHRDFYICHFLLNTTQANSQIHLSLIDLHRAHIRPKTPERWIIKDLAGLYFSSKDIGLTQRDLFRFMKVYEQKSLRDILESNTTFWQKVKTRGEQLYSDHAR